MKFDYQSIFVGAHPSKNKKLGHRHYTHEVNGVEFTRDVQSVLERMTDAGYELTQSIPIISTTYHTKTYTEGVTLIFKKEIGQSESQS